MTTPALAAESVQIDDLVIASPLGDQQGAIVVKAARAFHDFWHTGNETALKQAIATAIAPIRMVGHGDTGAIAHLAPYLFAGANTLEPCG